MNTDKHASDYTNIFLWILIAGIPITCMFLSFSTETGTLVNILALLVLSVMAAWLDMNVLERANRHAPDVWTIALVPVYLWQRITRNHQTVFLLLAWLAAVILAIFISVYSDVIKIIYVTSFMT